MSVFQIICFLLISQNIIITVVFCNFFDTKSNFTQIRTNNLSGNVELTTLEVIQFDGNNLENVGTIPNQQNILLTDVGTKVPTDGTVSMDVFNSTSGGLSDNTNETAISVEFEEILKNSSRDEKLDKMVLGTEIDVLSNQRVNSWVDGFTTDTTENNAFVTQQQDKYLQNEIGTDLDQREYIEDVSSFIDVDEEFLNSTTDRVYEADSYEKEIEDVDAIFRKYERDNQLEGYFKETDKETIVTDKSFRVFVTMNNHEILTQNYNLTETEEVTGTSILPSTVEFSLSETEEITQISDLASTVDFNSTETETVTENLNAAASTDNSNLSETQQVTENLDAADYNLIETQEIIETFGFVSNAENTDLSRSDYFHLEKDSKITELTTEENIILISEKATSENSETILPTSAVSELSENVVTLAETIEITDERDKTTPELISDDSYQFEVSTIPETEITTNTLINLESNTTSEAKLSSEDDYYKNLLSESTIGKTDLSSYETSTNNFIKRISTENIDFSTTPIPESYFLDFVAAGLTSFFETYFESSRNPPKKLLQSEETKSDPNDEFVEILKETSTSDYDLEKSTNFYEKETTTIKEEENSLEIKETSLEANQNDKELSSLNLNSNLTSLQMKFNDKEPQISTRRNNRNIVFSVIITLNESSFFIPSYSYLKYKSPEIVNITWHSSNPKLNNSLEINLEKFVQLNIVKENELYIYKLQVTPQIRQNFEEKKHIAINHIQLYFSNTDFFDPKVATFHAEILALEIAGISIALFAILAAVIYLSVRKRKSAACNFKPNPDA